MEEITRSQVSILAAFHSVNPIKWESLMEDLKLLDYKNFGSGIAMGRTGEETPMMAAQKENFQWLYLPNQKHLILNGNDIDETTKQFTEIINNIKTRIKPSKWDKRFHFYEIHCIYEFEPNNITPMDIMSMIAPKTSLAGLSEIFEGKQTALYALRLAKWQNDLPTNLRESVPWFEIALQPMVENSDRFISEIISRSVDFEITREKADKLRTSVFNIIRELDKSD